MKVYTAIRSWGMEETSDILLIGVFQNKEAAFSAALAEYNMRINEGFDSLEVTVLETEINNIYTLKNQPKEIWWNGEAWS